MKPAPRGSIAYPAVHGRARRAARTRAAKWTASVAAVALATGSVASASDVPAVPAVDGPHVVKLDWDTRALRTADLDGDGRREVVVINNDRGRIEIVDAAAWSEAGDPERDGRRRVTTAAKAYDLAIGDLDGDGRDDLVYTAEPGGLVARLQTEPFVFGEAIRKRDVDPFGWPETIAFLARTDAPGHDLAVLSKDGVGVYRLEEGAWIERAQVPLEDGDPFAIRACDLDGDGVDDILYRMAKADRPLRLRLRRDDGLLGPERALSIERVASPIETLPGEDGTPRIAWIEAKSHALRTARLVRRTADREPARDRYRAPIGDAGIGAWARGDLDGDGMPEWYVADSGGARVWRFAPLPSGDLDAPEAFPAFAGVRMLAVGDFDGDGVDELAMASAKESAIGIARRLESGRLAYPQVVPTEGRPQALAAGDFDGDGRTDLAYARDAEEDGREIVPVYSESGGWRVDEPAHLEDADANVRALVARDLDGDGASEMLVFVPKSALRLVEFPRGGAREIPKSDRANGTGAVDDLRPAEIAFADVDGDGEVEWLAAGEGRVRVLAWSRDGGFEVVDQLNTAEPGARVRAVFTALEPGSAERDVWIAVGDEGTLERMSRDSDGVWRSSERFDGSPLEPRAVIADVDGAWLAGRDALERVRLGGTRWTVAPDAAFEIDLDDVRPVKLAVGDWNDDGVPEAAIVDALESRILQVVGADDEGWSRRLHFRVFEVDPAYSGPRGASREPREIVWSDLDGDGSDDLLLLVHDRVLIYEVESPEPAVEGDAATAELR